MGTDEVTSPSQRSSPRISAVINTLNAAGTLRWCLQSVSGWADQIVVVDMHSDDGTAEIAREFGAEVHLHERTGYVEPARKFAVGLARGDWILVVDADEIAPRPLREILSRVAGEDVADVVQIPTFNYMMGSLVGWTGWGPTQDYHPRFFKAGHVRLESDIHAGMQAPPGSRGIRITPRPGCGLVHFNYYDFSDFLERLNRYTTIEASEKRIANQPSSTLWAIASAARWFSNRYATKGGYRDGWRGLYLSAFMGFYRLSVFAKLRELETVGTRDDVERIYEVEAQRWLSM